MCKRFRFDRNDTSTSFPSFLVRVILLFSRKIENDISFFSRIGLGLSLSSTSSCSGDDTNRVEFLLKTDSGYPKDTGVNKPWQLLGIPFAIIPISQFYQSPPSPIPGDLGRGPSHQSHVLEHKDTYGQAQVCSKGHQCISISFFH